VLDYAHAPLVLSQTIGGATDEVGAIVRHRLVAHASFALGLGDRVELSLGLPLALVQKGQSPAALGESFAAPSAPALGDPSVGASVRLVGEAPSDDEPGGFQLAVAGAFLLPVGSQSGLSGDGSVGARGHVLAAVDTPNVTPMFDAGIAYRPSRTYVSAELGTELLLGAGLQVHLEPVQLMFELAFATMLRAGQAFSSEGTGLEALLGVRYEHTSGFTVGAAGGLGLIGTVGVPDGRGLLTVGFAPPRERSESATTEPFEEVPGLGVATDNDRDGDGIEDTRDGCPQEAEDRDGFEDADGCPDADNDADGVPDTTDECAAEAETVNGLRDDDGCPENVEITDTHIQLGMPVTFGRRSAEIGPAATEPLGLLVELLRSRTDLTLIQVEGRASQDEGRRRQQLDMSERRATAVISFLVERGIDASRLIAVGLGADQPLEGEDGTQNRRVEFRVVERSR